MNDLLTRAVSKVIPGKLAEEKLQSGPSARGRAGKPLRVYLGIDPTGARLHLGHSVPLRKLQKFADAGHHAIFLIGSFTGMIGDPSGHDAQRAPLTREEVERNFETYRMQASKVLDFDKVQIVFNHEWLEKLTAADILRLASHFTKQQMEQRDLFVRREREGKPVSIHEFLYPILVGYDSVMLDVDCELGGSDQEFNMLAGRTLQSAYGKREKFVLTTKLIEGTDGRKMSKSYGNCVYLDDPPNEMYGKLMSIRDELVPIYMECCTGIPMTEVQRAQHTISAPRSLSRAESRDGCASRAIQRAPSRARKETKSRLAREIVAIYHGAAAAAKAEREFEKIFREKGIPDDVPEARVGKDDTLIDVLVSEKLVKSKSEARRLIEQGAITVNGQTVIELESKFGEGFASYVWGKDAVIKVGKRKFLRVRIEQKG